MARQPKSACSQVREIIREIDHEKFSYQEIWDYSKRQGAELSDTQIMSALKLLQSNQEIECLNARIVADKRKTKYRMLFLADTIRHYSFEALCSVYGLRC